MKLAEPKVSSTPAAIVQLRSLLTLFLSLLQEKTSKNSNKLYHPSKEEGGNSRTSKKALEMSSAFCKEILQYVKRDALIYECVRNFDAIGMF